ncbi:ribonuclease Z [Porphyromonas sp. COT-108 OH2963]|uniref:ribonuclease Z n=1 Tax=Porphyromonas sp. COT-108 OH2963 TaxID=1515614 RepID=UPI00068BDA5C|nr:ribonuclease Z [Porphyromonas sp. COT-108 OH2963]
MSSKKSTLHYTGDGMCVHILGCGSAKPSLSHFPSAQMVRLRDKCFLMDCGEGTQIQLLKYRVPFSSLHRIFISHMHGDHCLGLPGLLSTMALQKLTFPMHIYGPKGIADFVDYIVRTFCAEEELRFHVHEIDHKAAPMVVFEDKSITVEAIPLKHRMPAVGYLFREKNLLKALDRSSADFYGVPVYWFNRIKSGADFITEDGIVIPNSRLTHPSRKPYSYAYISDTAYSPSIVPHIRGVDLLYHEATFEKSLKERAAKTFHSTTEHAGKIAAAAEVGHLLIGHYSARYSRSIDMERLRSEAAEHHPRTIAANEGMFLDLKELRSQLQ